MKLLAARRLLRIQRVVIRYQLDELLFALRLPLWMRVLGALLPWRWLPRKPLALSRGERLRLALEDLGPIFIKFGQLLSTRRDLLPPDIADELAKLQDQVRSVYGENATVSQDLWAQFLNFQGPAMQSMMGAYMEQSKKMYAQMQEQLDSQTRNLFSGFQFPAFPAGFNPEKLDPDTPPAEPDSSAK